MFHLTRDRVNANKTAMRERILIRLETFSSLMIPGISENMEQQEFLNMADGSMNLNKHWWKVI